MITLLLILTAICLIGLVVLIIGGLFTIFWPLALILVIGFVLDLFVIKALITKKK